MCRLAGILVFFVACHGAQAQHRVIPWAVSMTSPRCSGVLISPTRVLTSAQCVTDSYSDGLLFGSAHHSNGNNGNGNSWQHGYIARRYVHYGYRRDKLVHDIAILEMDFPVNVTDTVYPIRLPRPSVDGSYESFENAQATLCGWGRASYPAVAESVTPWIQVVNVTVLSNAMCAETKFGAFIRNSTICARGQLPTESLCTGDPGSGLYMHDSEGTATLIGLGSFISADGCDVTNSTSGFTRITDYMAWIKADTPQTSGARTLLVSGVLLLLAQLASVV